MDVNLIITIVVYALFFLSILLGALWGLGRGLKKSSLRLATLVGFIIIAGIITPLISRALLTLDLSWLGIDIGGNAVTSISGLIDSALSQIPQFEQISTLPSVLTFVEGLPIAVLNIIVFMLLIFIMKFLSWILFVILAKTTLKETKLEKQIKKQRKLEKQIKNQKQLNPDQKKLIPIVPPKKRRMLGGLVGMVQGFILIFLILMPVTSLLGSFGEITSTPQGVVAEEGDPFGDEFLNETTGDLLRNALGEEVFGYFETYNNAFPTKALNLLGLNSAIFDSLTSVSVNNQNIALRRDVVNAAGIYNEIVSIKNEIDTNETWSELSFDGARNIIRILFDTGIVKAFAEDAIPYIVDMLNDNNTFDEMEFGTDIYNGIQKIVDCYENDPDGFINGIKNDFLILVNVAETVFESGIFDEIMSSNDSYEDYIAIIEENDYEIITDITAQIFDSFMFRVLVSSGLNIGLEMGSNELSNDGVEIDLGTTDYDEINWDLVENSFSELITNGLDIFEILNSYNIIDNFENPETILNQISSSNITALMSLFGREIDLIKDSPLFAGQETTPFTGLVSWAEEELPEFIDSTAILGLTSWADEFENLSSSIVMFKECGLLDYVMNSENMDLADIFDIILAPSSEELNADSYMVAMISPILQSSLIKKPLVYGLNQINPSLEEVLELENELEDYTNITNAQINEILNIIRKAEDVLTILFNDETTIDFETFGEPEDIINLLNSDNLSKVGEFLEAIRNSAFGIFDVDDFEDEDFDFFLENYNLDGGGLFANLYVSLIVRAGILIPDFLDSKVLIKVPSWATEFNNLGISVDYAIESGALDTIIENTETVDFNTVINMLTAPVSEVPDADSYLVEILTPIINSSLSKKAIVYGLNQLNTELGDAMELTLTDFNYETFPDDQNNDIVDVAENIANAFSLFSEGLIGGEEEEEGDFNLSDLELTKLAGLLTALQQNAFRIGTDFEVGTDSIDLINKTVTNGGIFANYYVSMINYIVGDESGINYKTVDWLAFFESAQALSGILDSIGGEEGDISDFLDLGNPETEEDLSTIFDSLGFGQDEDENGTNDFVEEIVELQEIIIEGLEQGTIDEEDVYNQINDVLDGLINSENEDGTNTIDSIIDMIENITGDDSLSEQINSTVLASEQTVTNRLYLLLFNYTNSVLTPLDYLDDTPDTNDIEKTKFEATISDLTCGATFVLQQAVSNGTKIYLENIDALTLESAIDAALSVNGITDIEKIAEIKGYLLTGTNHLFEIV